MSDRPQLKIATVRPHKWNSLVGSAQVVTSRSVKRHTDTVGLERWQEDAWRFYDGGLTGELRFGISWLSNGLSRVNLVAARPPRQVGDEPTPISTLTDEDMTAGEKRAAELVRAIGGGPSGQGQLMAQFGKLLPTQGFSWLVVEPDLSDPESIEYSDWQVLSQDMIEIKDAAGGEQTYRIQTGESSDNGWRDAHPNVLIVKCWKPHPRRRWEPDAQIRGVLGVLTQIELFSAHLSATAQSRLAGAGILFVPSELEFPEAPTLEGFDLDPDEPEQDAVDRFTEALMDMMMTALRDRDNASAITPLVVSVPGEFIDKIKHISFATEFDSLVGERLDQAIKRLALGLDMPPEVLTGMAGVNHWTAWQVEDTAITLHIEPTAEIVCHALTDGYLAEALEADGFDRNEAMVWYSTEDLTKPPDKSGNAQQVYDANELSSASYRREMGFGEEDKPDALEKKERILLSVAKGAPTLAPAMLAAAGILPEAVAVAAEGVAPAPNTPAPGDGPVVDVEPVEVPPAGPPSAAALIAACDGVVYRAMERAGTKLRSAVGRKVDGGPQSIETTDTLMHCSFDATVYADFDHLLAGAFVRVPELAAHHDVDADALTATLTAYCRSLLASGHPHDRHRLSTALGTDPA